MWTSSTKGAYAYTRTFMQGKARTIGFGPWYLDHGILIHGIGPWYLIQSVEPRYLVQGIGSKWFWTMVLSKA